MPPAVSTADGSPSPGGVPGAGALGAWVATGAAGVASDSASAAGWSASSAVRAAPVTRRKARLGRRAVEHRDLELGGRQLRAAPPLAAADRADRERADATASASASGQAVAEVLAQRGR